MHGEPLELSDVSVLGLSDGTFTLTAFTPGLEVTLGPMAHIMVRPAAWDCHQPRILRRGLRSDLSPDLNGESRPERRCAAISGPDLKRGSVPAGGRPGDPGLDAPLADLLPCGLHQARH